MGFDLQRFPNCIDEEFLCSICAGVLQDPIQAPACEHTFCQKCIQEWLLRSQTCPIDRTSIEIDQLTPVPRILKNLLNRLEISCENQGCQSILKLEQLSTHLSDCQFNPNEYIQCEKGCQMSITKAERSTHNCIDVLRTELHATRDELEKSRTDLLFYQTELQLLHEHLRTSRSNRSSTHACSFPPVENDEIHRWSNGLQLARVTHWGGMISTPDGLSQEAMRSALIESQCPTEWVEVLIEKAHERHWPEGLATLETRQENRPCYERYICRRLLEKQAVVILSCENRHMNQSMISEPGLLVIFSHGVK